MKENVVSYGRCFSLLMLIPIPHTEAAYDDRKGG